MVEVITYLDEVKTQETWRGRIDKQQQQLLSFYSQKFRYTEEKQPITKKKNYHL